MKHLSVHTVTPGDIVQLAKDKGYKLLAHRGKGSHLILKKEGCPTITLPGGRYVGRNVARRMMKILLSV